jgi:hypothetical protein
MRGVLAQDGQQVSRVVDQDPVKALAALRVPKITSALILRVPNIHPCWSNSLGPLIGAEVSSKLLDECK